MAITDEEIARRHVFDWLALRKVPTSARLPLVCVRLNSLDSAFCEADNRATVQALRLDHGPEIVVLPKLESAAALT